MPVSAPTVEAYLDSLPDERRAVLEAVRRVILDHLDPDYEEGMQYGMIGYYVPHRIFPAGYHCDPRQPVPYAALAAQKNNFSLYLMGVYVGGDAAADAPESAVAQWFREAWRNSGKKLDMGKSCVRFKKLEDVPLDVVGEVIRRIPAATYIARYQSVLDRLAAEKAARKNSAKR